MFYRVYGFSLITVPYLKPLELESFLESRVEETGGCVDSREFLLVSGHT